MSELKIQLDEAFDDFQSKYEKFISASKKSTKVKHGAQVRASLMMIKKIAHSLRPAISDEAKNIAVVRRTPSPVLTDIEEDDEQTEEQVEEQVEEEHISEEEETAPEVKIHVQTRRGKAKVVKPIVKRPIKRQPKK